jgi:hypothetical protein
MPLHFILNDLRQMLDAKLLRGVEYKIVEDGEDVAIQLTDNITEPIITLAYSSKNDAIHLYIMYRLTLAPIPRDYLTAEIYESLTQWTAEFGLSLDLEESKENSNTVIPIAVVWVNYSNESRIYAKNVNDALTRIRRFHVKHGDDLNRLFSGGL